MSKSAEPPPLTQSHTSGHEPNAKRIARAAAELSRRHTTRFAHLAALARTLESYIPSNAKKQGEYAQLARMLVEFADQFRQDAEIDDIVFSIITHDTQDLLDDDVRARFLERASRHTQAAAPAGGGKPMHAKDNKILKPLGARLRKPAKKPSTRAVATTH